MGEIFFAWIIDKLLDMSCGMFAKANEKDIKYKLIEMINTAARRAFAENGIDTWQDDAFKNYLNYSVIKDNNIPVFIMNSQLARNVLGAIMPDEQHFLITEKVLNNFSLYCIEEIANDVHVSFHIVLTALIANNTSREVEMSIRQDILEHIKIDIKNHAHNNMYQDLGFFNRVIYPYLCTNLVQGCSTELLEIAYFLADIYDQTSEYQKSMNLAKLIMDIINPLYCELSAHHIRQLIGCIYSYIIPKDENIEKKEEMLARAEADMKVVKGYINNWVFHDNLEKRFIEGLYASNFGALLANKADVEEKKGNIENRNELLDAALKYHEQARVIREMILNDFINPSNILEYEKIERYYYQSKSNIAGILFRQKKFEEAKKKHKEVLQYRLNKGEIINTYLTKGYIIGCYIGMAREQVLDENDIFECKKFIDECKEYYLSVNDVNRLKDINNKEKLFNELI